MLFKDQGITAVALSCFRALHCQLLSIRNLQIIMVEAYPRQTRRAGAIVGVDILPCRLAVAHEASSSMSSVHDCGSHPKKRTT